MTISKNSSIKSFFLLGIIISFVIGFVFREFAPGGAAADFDARTWLLIESFKNNFYLTIKNYGKFGDASYPLFYIFNAYLNPFTSNKIQYLISNTFISFVTFIFLPSY